MTFRQFLKEFEGGWLKSEGFLHDALGDPLFPDIQDWASLDVYLAISNAGAQERKEARLFWDEYQAWEDERREEWRNR